MTNSNLDTNKFKIGYSSQPALDRIANMGIFDTQCEGHQILEKIANKWTILIIYALTQRKKRYSAFLGVSPMSDCIKKRYSDLKQQIVGISSKMLIQNLRNLERSGLVKRDIYPVVPPKVDYSLTPLGESLAEPLAVLGEWAYQHISDVNASIEEYGNSPKTEDFWQPK